MSFGSAPSPFTDASILNALMTYQDLRDLIGKKSPNFAVPGGIEVAKIHIIGWAFVQDLSGIDQRHTIFVGYFSHDPVVILVQANGPPTCKRELGLRGENVRGYLRVPCRLVRFRKIKPC